MRALGNICQICKYYEHYPVDVVKAAVMLTVPSRAPPLSFPVAMDISVGYFLIVLRNFLALIALPVPMLRQVFLDLNPLHRHGIRSTFHEN